jgi:hypothetical protein
MSRMIWQPKPLNVIFILRKIELATGLEEEEMEICIYPREKGRLSPQSVDPCQDGFLLLAPDK